MGFLGEYGPPDESEVSIALCAVGAASDRTKCLHVPGTGALRLKDTNGAQRLVLIWVGHGALTSLCETVDRVEALVACLTSG